MLHLIGFIIEIAIEFGVCALAGYLAVKGLKALSEVELPDKESCKRDL